MSNVHLFPVSVFFIFQVSFIGSYIAAVVQGHVVPTVPYISDAATYSPESCVFGQLMNIGAVLMGITMYIRYRQVLELYRHCPDIGGASLLKYNKLALWFGTASCLGVSIVANFQETNIRIAHYVGAMMCLGSGTMFFWMQAFISYIIHPMSGSKLKAQLRLGMVVCCTILFIVLVVTSILAHIFFRGENQRKWYPSDGGWHFHVVSSVSEWILATIFCFYILTFTDEFRDMELDHPKLTLVAYRITL